MSRYSPRTAGSWRLSACLECGAAVDSQVIHDQWHDRQEALLRLVKATGRVVKEATG